MSNGSWKNWLLAALATGAGMLIVHAFTLIEETNIRVLTLESKVLLMERLILPKQAEK